MRLWLEMVFHTIKCKSILNLAAKQNACFHPCADAFKVLTILVLLEIEKL
jgi:hypothetical protein